MQIAIGDIWTKMSDDSSAVCVTTNGIWKKNGLAVMGKGIAKDADVRYQVSSQLGKNLRKHGNHVCDLGRHISPNGHSFTMLAFPTKQHWKNPSDIRLIRRSAEELVALTNTMGFWRNLSAECGPRHRKLAGDNLAGKQIGKEGKSMKK